MLKCPKQKQNCRPDGWPKGRPMLKKEARQITGGLSKPSKMPGPAHNLPAQACLTGAKLVKVPGSVCAGCYALKGRYRFNNVQAALNRRLQALEDQKLGTGASKHWKEMRKLLTWFMKNNAKAYMVLLD